MFKLEKTISIDSEDFSADLEFWPKQAEQYLLQREFEKVIELCEQNLTRTTNLLSAKLIYSRALVNLKRFDDASEQLYNVLSTDPDNIVALKLLGDIRYAQDDVVSAMASYSRILEIDPDCRGIKSELPVTVTETEPEPIKKLVLQRASETTPEPKTDSLQVQRPFRTETVGDLYLAQGQPRLAMEIFKELADLHQNNRLREKLSNAEKMAALKERRDVEQKN